MVQGLLDIKYLGWVYSGLTDSNTPFDQHPKRRVHGNHGPGNHDLSEIVMRRTPRHVHKPVRIRS